MPVQILELRMVNVKCYDDVTYTFQPGINFISGLNGAGKSTIIEAIGFALFDNIDYTAKQFTKEGKRSGEVQVLIEANDQRLYRIVRKFNTNALTLKWEVYDEESGAILEQLHGNQDVVNWIKANIGLAPEDNLRELYRQVISVQQGAFTTPFLETPAQRRDTFEAILGVEGYRKVYNKTSGLNAEFSGPIARLETEIMHIEEQVVNLPKVEEQIKQLTKETIDKTNELETISKQYQEQQQFVNQLLRLKTEIDSLQQAIKLNQQSLEHYQEQEHNLVQAISEAEMANRIIQEAAPGFRLYQAKQHELAELEQAQVKQRKLQTKLDSEEKQYAIARAEYQSKTQELARRKEESAKKQQQLTTELKQKTQVLELAKSNVEHVVAYQQEITEDLFGLQRVINWFKSNELLLDDAYQKQVLMDDYLAQLASLKKETEDLPRLLDELKGQEQAAQLEAVLERKAKLIGARDALVQNRQYLEQGICPIIHETCPSTKVAGNLSSYYHNQLASLTDEIALLEQAEVTERQLQAKILELKGKIDRAKNAQQSIEDLEKRISDIVLAIQEAASSLDQNLLADLVTETVTTIGGIVEKHKAFQFFVATTFNNAYSFMPNPVPKIDWSILQLPQAQTEVTNWLVKFKEQKQQLAHWVKEQLEQGQSLQEWLRGVLNQAENQVQLAKQDVNLCENLLLEEKRQLEAIVAAENQLEQQLQVIKEQEQELASLRMELEKFASLEQQIIQVKQLLQENQSHYEQYKENITMASRLAGLQCQYQELQGKQSKLQEQLTQQQKTLAELGDKYDPEEHQQADQFLQNLLLNKNTLELELKQLEKALGELTKELERIQTEQQRLATKQEELEVLLEARGLLQLIRQVLQAAADPIAQRYRTHISTLASGIYRSISGENVYLEWADQYEVIMKDNAAGFGRERVFKQLSGGEQMTAALAIRLALMQTFSDVGVGFFDEPTANLDVERRESLGFAIQKSVQQFNQLFVISHDDAFDAVTEHTILVKHS